MRVRSSLAIVVAIAALAVPTLASAAGNPKTVAIVDTLAGVSTETSFSVFGSGGMSILSEQQVGPRFTLTQRTFITEIGAYMNTCDTIQEGVPLCPDRAPLVVQIRPADGGLPDLDTVLAEVELTGDTDPLLVSFERASMHLTLPAGTYFALFALGSSGGRARVCPERCPIAVPLHGRPGRNRGCRCRQ